MSTLLAGLGREATGRVRRAMRPLGLGAQQFVVMKQLQALGQTSQAELADALAIHRSNLAAIAADLAARDLVERTRHEVDRRRYVLRLSRAGEQLLVIGGATACDHSITSSQSSRSTSVCGSRNAPCASAIVRIPAACAARAPPSPFGRGILSPRLRV